MDKDMYEFKWSDSPIGQLKLVAKEDALVGILWEIERFNRVKLTPMIENQHNPILLETATQLKQYFSGERKDFNIKLDFKGTVFQKKVWAALLTIPFGESRTYGEIAKQIGYPKAVRAVGAANGKNPISIITPCHRVIGANGKLTGFAGGLLAKQYLLDNEDLRLTNEIEQNHMEKLWNTVSLENPV